MASVPTNLPVLLIEVSEDISEFNNVIGQVIPGNLQNFIQVVPATGEVALVATNTSRSYAQSQSTIKVFNDRIFIVNVSDTGARVQEINLDSIFNSPASVPVPTPRSQDSLSENCLAVIGDDLIFKVAHREAPFPATGFEDGPLLRIGGFFSATGGQAIDTLIPGLAGQGTSPSPGGFVTDACRGYFDVNGNNWYDSEIGFANGFRRLLQKDLATGTPTEFAALQDLAPLQVSEFTYDNDTVYFVALDAGSQSFMIASASLATGNVDFRPVEAIADYVSNFTATGAQLIDADDGYLGFVLDGNTRDVVMLYEPVSGLIEAFDFDVRINQMQLIYRDI